MPLIVCTTALTISIIEGWAYAIFFNCVNDSITMRVMVLFSFSAIDFNAAFCLGVNLILQISDFNVLVFVYPLMVLLFLNVKVQRLVIAIYIESDKNRMFLGVIHLNLLLGCAMCPIK